MSLSQLQLLSADRPVRLHVRETMLAVCAQDYWTFTDGKVCNKTASVSSSSGGFGLPQRSSATGGTVDLWNDYTGIPETFGRPGHEYQNGVGCTEEHQSTTAPGGRCVYEDQLFETRVHDIIKDNKAAAKSGAKPLFIFWAPRQSATFTQPHAETCLCTASCYMALT